MAGVVGYLAYPEEGTPPISISFDMKKLDSLTHWKLVKFEFP